MIDKDMRLHRSNVAVTAAQHETALNKGTHELRPPVVIHRWGDKLYMMEEVGRNAPVNYEDQFVLDP